MPAADEVADDAMRRGLDNDNRCRNEHCPCYDIIHSRFLSFILPIDFASAAESAAEPVIIDSGVYLE